MKVHAPYLFVISAMLLYIIFLRECTGKCPATVVAAASTTKTTAHNDTGKSYIPQPVAVNGVPITKVIKGKTEYVPIYINDSIPALAPPQKIDTQAILRNYYNSYSYAISNYGPTDSLRKKFGYVLAHLEVSKNKIEAVYWENHLLSTETTITKTVQKLQGWIGLGIYGNKQTPIGGYDLGLTIKTKTNSMYNVGIAYMPGGVVWAHAGMSWPIHFGKK